MPVLAKLSRPRLSGVCAPPRLLERLDELRRAGTVWMAGPPGAGKTTLAASYLAARGLAAAWYRVDEGDRDIASFFHYLALAVRQAAPRGKALPAFSPEYGAAPGAFARLFFREAWEQLGDRILVLDDYQEARSPSPLDEVMRVALSELPERSGVLVASREPPPPALTRLLANGAMAHLAPAELKLTVTETAALAEARGGAALTAPAIEHLHRLADGWAAGLVLMLAAAHPEGNPGRPAPEAPQALFDYFASEIFDRFPEHVRRLLVETALLARIPGDAAEELTGSPGARSALADLARGGYFVVRLDQREEVYELHPLLREFLLERSRESLSPARRREIQTDAARLLAASGDAEAAVALLGDAGAFAELGRLVVERAPELLRDGRWQTLGDWIGLIPAEEREGQPWLDYWLGQSRLPVAPREAREHLERAFRLFLEQGDAAGSYLAWSSVTQSYIFEWGDLAPLDRWIEAFEELRRRWPTAPHPEIEAAAVCGMFTALTYRQPRHPEMSAWLDRARAVALGNADVRLRRAVAFTFTNVEVARLDLAEANRFVEVLAPPAEAATSDPAAVVLHCVARANVEAIRGHRAEALGAVQEGLALARRVGLRFWEPILHHGAVCAYLALDDVENARASLRAMDESLDRTLRANEACYEQMASMVTLRAGDPARALRHGERGLELARACGGPFWEGMAEVGVAVARLAMGDRQHAEAYARSGPPSHPPCWTLGRIYASAASAAAALRRGDEDLAAELLAAPFPAESPGAAQLHLHIWVGRAEAAELCALALERGIGPQAARSIVRTQGLAAPERAGPSWPWPAKIWTLGRFEVELGGELLHLGARSSKPLELLHALVALGPGDVAEGDLVEALWPHAEGDAGQHALETTSYRLRKLLGSADLVQHRDRRVSLDRGQCWVDVDAVSKLLRRASALSARTPWRPSQTWRDRCGAGGPRGRLSFRRPRDAGLRRGVRARGPRRRWPGASKGRAVPPGEPEPGAIRERAAPASPPQCAAPKPRRSSPRPWRS